MSIVIIEVFDEFNELGVLEHPIKKKKEIKANKIFFIFLLY
jgi:hypothetical protein